MKIRYALGVATALVFSPVPIDVQFVSATDSMPDVFCTTEARRLGVTDDDDPRMLLRGCDNYYGVWLEDEGRCAAVALDLVRSGFDGETAEDFYLAVNDAKPFYGECTVYEDGSWSDPTGIRSL